MHPFFRFVLLLLVLGIAMALAIVTTSNRQIQAQRRNVEVSERELLAKHLHDIESLVRTADLVIERQTIAGDNRVVQTDLLLFPYGWDATLRPISLPPRRFTIAGDRVSIDAERIECPNGILDDGFPQGISVTVFGHIYGADEEPAEENLFIAPGLVHPGYRPDPDFTSDFERQVWQHLAEYNFNDAAARRHGVQLRWFPAISARMRPGVIYRVFLDPIVLGDKPQLHIEELEDPKQISELLSHATQAIAGRAETQP